MFKSVLRMCLIYVRAIRKPLTNQAMINKLYKKTLPTYAASQHAHNQNPDTYEIEE
jgi:hypothetical protein